MRDEGNEGREVEDRCWTVLDGCWTVRDGCWTDDGRVMDRSWTGGGGPWGRVDGAIQV